MGKVAFKQCDVERAVRAVRAVGETVRGVEIKPDGSIQVLTGAGPAEKALSPLEAWKQKHGYNAA